MCREDMYDDASVSKCLGTFGILIGQELLRSLIEGDVEEDNLIRRQYIHVPRTALLRNLQNLIGRIAPESAKILRDRNQELGSGANRPVLKNIRLDGVFDHLMRRFEEIALCVPPLLNSTQLPLQHALQGCNVLAMK